ncbi:Ada metal-binding domain-containing protein [Prescottella defluvii]|uniref:AlkA N-terminal domain-containing protein n=1 Tax=Prescottella defluvii TaxID=1323361 RepID=UPI0004F396F9|nr:Ada metal-binding domain-containing protein [Prescottella defluvii]
MISDDGKYQAVCSRDVRFDGEFFVAVATTGIYCRPSCPATTPKRANVRFFPTAAAAQGSGFRACRRCRPDAVPGSAAWDARADVVGRAMRLIADGVVDREGVSGLAARLGYSARQVQRQLNAEVGAGPTALARARRAHTARILLQTTSMPVTDVAFAAGFASVRQFNDTVNEIYAATPTGLRDARPRSATRFGDVGVAGAASGIALRLPFRGPYAATEMFDALASGLVPGVEEMTGAAPRRRYRRTLRLPHGVGIAEVGESVGDGWLDCRLCLQDLRDLPTAAQRVRRLFDLDADPDAVADRLGGALSPVVAARPGLRSAGTVDPHELAVRALAGTAAEQLVQRYGQPLGAARGGLTHLFPRIEDLADASLSPALPRSARRTLRVLARRLADGEIVLDAGVDRAAAEKALLDVAGIGPARAAYIRMRGLGDPDVLLVDDADVRAGMARLGLDAVDADRWRPWRSYAGLHLAATARDRRNALSGW